VGFDRKKDFSSSFKENRKSNKASKNLRKEGGASHDHAGMAGATHGHAHSCACGRASWHGRAPSPAHAASQFSAYLMQFLVSIWREVFCGVPLRTN